MTPLLLRPVLRLAPCLVLLLPLQTEAATTPASAPAFDLGSGVSDYRRFMVYPHLQKGFSALQQGQRELSLQEFTRARELLPENPLLALYLADALRRFDETAHARAVLNEQLRMTPAHPQVLAALASLSTVTSPAVALVTAVPATDDCSTPDSTRCRLRRSEAALQSGNLMQVETVLADNNFARQPEGLVMRRALLQRAIYLHDWPRAETQLRALERVGQLTPQERKQWFNLLLLQGRQKEARALEQRFGNPLLPWQRLALAQAAAGQGSPALQAALAGPPPVFNQPAMEREWIVLLEKASSDDNDLLAAFVPRHAGNRLYHATASLPRLFAHNDLVAAHTLLERLPASALRAERITLALRRSQFDLVVQQAQALRQGQGPAPAQLDSLSYELLTAGAQAQALQLLLPAYPYASAGSAQQMTLLQRLALLAAEQPAAFSGADRARLQIPLSTPGLRSAQAALFAGLQDCEPVRALLGDLNTNHDRNDWMRLGDCYRDSHPGLAQFAYAQARARQNDADTTRALAYQAFANKDYATALDAWHSLPPQSLSTDDMMAAATTALSAGNTAAANDWLDQYAASNGVEHDVYWWRRAQAKTVTNPALAHTALEQAIRQRPQATYYAKLATLQEAEGQTALAVQALEMAVALEPQNPEWQVQLGFAYDKAGQPAQARAQFEAARLQRPDDATLVQQLVYISQRQGDVVAARHYASAAIDELDARGEDAEDDDARAQRFALTRLHEDLGRHWVMSADLWTGAGLATADNTAAPGNHYRSYLQLEAEYRLPPGQPLRLLAPYMRLLASSGEEDSALPIYSPQLGLGLRLRPLQTQTLALALEQQFSLDKGSAAQTDTMLRASASLLDGGRFSGEWHATGSSWLTQTLYLDAAYFLNSERQAATADYRLGYQYKTGRSLTLEPYGHVQYNRINEQVQNEDVRAGLGVRWNLWYAESRYDAWRHKASIGLEFQHAFTSWLSDTNSLSLSLGARW